MRAKSAFLSMAAALTILVYWSCTKLSDDTATHPEGWLDTMHDTFHGLKVSVSGLESCARCHGEQLDGGSADQACSDGTCHAGGSAIPHPENWRMPGSENFHGNYASSGGFDPCAVCHGVDFSGGVTGIACSNTICHSGPAAIPHPEGWTEPDSGNFHSNWIPVLGLDNCASCHGEEFEGGAGGSCSNASCHTGGNAIPHPTGWIATSSDDFHGDWIPTTGLSSCKVCHGSDLSGGTIELACSNTTCHTSLLIPHPQGWTISSDDDFHGDWVATVGLGYNSCDACHGDDLSGGIAEIACSNTICHTEGGAIPHPDEWTTSGAVLFHGNWVREVGDAPCADCHGSDYSGGFTEIACTNASCHVGGGASPHPVLAEFTDPSHANYHGAIFWDNNFDFTDCQDCHGDNLAGGVVDYSCSKATCHTATEGVFACDNCHSGPASSLPFVNVRNQTDSTNASVGLHNSHLGSFRSIRIPLVCDDCHDVPASMWATGHIDATPDEAEVPFGTLATRSGTLTPYWDHSAGTCADTYCHGNFAFAKDTSSYPTAYTDSIIAGNNVTVSWTGAYTGSDFCSFCHDMPPTGHPDAYTFCGGCHISVVGADHSSIIDSTKHINGQKNYP